MLSGEEARKIPHFPHLAPADAGARSATLAPSIVDIYARIRMFILFIAVYGDTWVYLAVDDCVWVSLDTLMDTWVSYP